MVRPGTPHYWGAGGPTQAVAGIPCYFFNDHKRVLVWRRGAASSQQPVVVVANFSDFTSANATTGQGEYIVHNWPPTPPGREWKEVTQDRIVPPEWVGREPIFSWEAKVYTLA